MDGLVPIDIIPATIRIGMKSINSFDDKNGFLYGEILPYKQLHFPKVREGVVISKVTVAN